MIHQHLTRFELVSGVVVCVFAIVLIVCMIAVGFKIAADARVEEEQQKCERRARQLARRMVRDSLKDVKITVTQRVSVVEDNLGKSRKDNEKK